VIYIPLVILVMLTMVSLADAATESRRSRRTENIQFAVLAFAVTVVYSLVIFTTPWLK